MMHHQKQQRVSTSKKMKKTTKRSIITVLPDDVIVEVIAQIASRSSMPFADLYSLRNTCKVFSALSKDKIVKQRIALEREFSTLNWTATDRRMDILNVCANAGNAEACFTLALIDIFEQGDVFKGADLLKMAISKGHKASSYFMNILHHRLKEHLLSADESSLDTFNTNEKSFCNDDQFKFCREKVLDTVRQVTWKKWQATGTGNEQQCKSSGCGIARGWDGHRNFCSDVCRWNYEHNELCWGL